MHRPAVGALALFTLLLACGDDGPEPIVRRPPAPAVADAFVDGSDLLPASRIADCFDARAHDIDDDGDLDLVIAVLGGPNLIYVNDGDGRFTDESTLRLPDNGRLSEHIALGDFDGDGDSDLVVANVREGSRGHEYYLNDGLGSFTEAPQGLPVSGLTGFVAAEDFDGDQDLDLFFGNLSQSQLLINDGSGAFADETSARLPDEEGITEDSGVGDIDGDGDLDIIVSLRGSAEGAGLQNLAWINDGTGVFRDETSARLPALRGSTFDTVLADIDGDGDLDVLMGNATVAEAGAPKLDFVHVNDGRGFFTDVTSNWPQNPLSNTFGVTPFDIDGDDDLDVLTAEWAFDGRGAYGRFRAFENDGDGVFEDRTMDLLGEVRANGVHIEAADFNGDQKTDLYFCSEGQTDGEAGGAVDYLFLAR